MVAISIWSIVFTFNLEEEPLPVLPEQLKEEFLEIPLWE